MIRLNAMPNHEAARQRNGIFNDGADLFVEFRHRVARPVYCLAFRDRTKVFLDPSPSLFFIEVARQDENGVVWNVVLPEESFYVIQSRGLQIFERADDGPVIRMAFRIHDLADLLERGSVWLVIDTL